MPRPEAGDTQGRGGGIAIFLEDPGAANFVLEMPEALARRGMPCVLAAMGHARKFLEQREVDHIPLSGPDAALAALDALAPRVAALGTSDRPDALNLLLAAACRRRGTPTVGFVDGYGNLERRFGPPEDPLAHAPDWILAPDAATREAYIGFGADPGRVLDCGHPGLERLVREGERLARLDRVALRARHFPGLPAGASALVFASEALRTPVPGQYERSPDYTFAGSGAFTTRTEIVLEEVLDALDRRAASHPPGPHMIVRLHPKNTPADFRPFQARIRGMSDGPGSHELLHAADAVIGMTTLLLAEAAYLGRPTLAVVPRAAEVPWLWTIGKGLTACARSREELDFEIGALLSRADCGASPRPPDPRGAAARMADLLARLAAPGAGLPPGTGE